jgi:hypothetical protein
MQAGYSGTPLPKKLGLKDATKVAFAALPDHLYGLTTARNFAAVDDVWPGLKLVIRKEHRAAHSLSGAAP